MFKLILLLFLVFLSISFCSLVTDQVCSKGEIIENMFILQNKRNSLVEQLSSLKNIINENKLDVKQLSDNRVQLNKLHASKLQSFKNLLNLCLLREIELIKNDIENLEEDLTVQERDLYNAHTVYLIYPRWIKELEFFVDYLNNVINRFIEMEDIEVNDMSKAVKQADLMKDISDIQAQILNLFLKIKSDHRFVKKEQNSLSQCQEEMRLLADYKKDPQRIKLLKSERELLVKTIKATKEVIELEFEEFNCAKKSLNFLIDSLILELPKEENNIIPKNWLATNLEQIENSINSIYYSI